MEFPTTPAVEAFTVEPGHRRNTVTDQIKNYILKNDLRPGDLMPTETEICATLGVSRSSVREAIRTLQALDIVEVRHGYGTYVGNLSLAPLVEGLVFRGVLSPENNFAALREVVEVREALDLAMAPAIVAALNGSADSVLKELVAVMVTKSTAGESFPDEDLAFHSRLLSYLDNALVGQLVAAFWEVNTVVYPLLGLPPAADMDETAKAHGAMLDAAQTGDLEAYKKAVIDHYQPLRRALEKATTVH
ncbi:GntR family transcriptional regulator [Subtercola boreus]|uniref:GntR family transcriptional regulator n=1 Tax=Subtercola boreus TaxID=120213 RepID=A0A3E0VED7_9MICO|nr:GntR family transcriptional regulator [Subtercola boreus]RFA08101.1 GntR family transcriptional regulator [Subtercola boreus]TQL55012.1 GntR family transcriptional regulator [Subtercola boreus]